MKILFTLWLAISSGAAMASPEIAANVMQEYTRLQKMVSKWEPEYDVGGYMNGKSFGDHEVLWRVDHSGDVSVIRIYREKSGGRDAFSATYHYGDHLVPGHTAIRRFIGPEPYGWRNDTIDAETGEYLGSQGMENPALDRRDREILKKWKIRF